MQQIEQTLKKYVKLQSEYKLATKIIQKHKQLQDQLKLLFDQAGIQEFTLRDHEYDATLAFKTITSSRLDIQSLPENLKKLYTRQFTSRRESLVIRNSKN